MDTWTKKASIEMLDSATTRKAVLAVADMEYIRLGHADWGEVWEYALQRFNHLPDDGTPLVEPGHLRKAQRMQLDDRTPEMSWDSALAISRAECRSLATNREGVLKTASVHVRLNQNRKNCMWREAKPWVLDAVGLPDAFSDWNGRKVDLRFELLGELKDHYTGLFGEGAAIAIKKGGRWWAMKSHGGVYSRSIDVLPISDAEAAVTNPLPEDWETRVAFE